MRTRIWSLLLLLALLIGGLYYRSRPYSFFPSFDEMQIQESYTPLELIDFYQHSTKKKWKLLERLYRTHLAGRKIRHKKEKIPKILHQISLGKTISEKQELAKNSWLHHHPDWEYLLWTKNEINQLFLQNQIIIDNSPTDEEKIALLSLEILYQYGGLFIADQIECKRPFDILNENCTFFAGTTNDIESPRLSLHLIGAVPGHEILKKAMQKAAREEDTFTTVFFEVVKKRRREPIVVLPSSYFFPSPQPRDHSFSAVCN